MNYTDITENTEYQLLKVVKHKEVRKLISEEVDKAPAWIRIANMYQLGGMLAFLIAGFKAFIPFMKEKEAENLIGMGIGIVFSFTLLIVLHELIHALAYRYVGVRNLSFGMYLKKFIFFVQADKGVLNYKQFQIVALAPTILIGTLAILLMVIFYNQPAFYFGLSVFAIHSLFCAGDFGLLSFFQNRPEYEILTFDLKDENATYFYGKRK